MSHEAWSRYRKLTLSIPALTLEVDLSKTSLADDALTSDPLVSRGFPEAFRSMAALEDGAIANPDEGRQVGHYWLRSPELAPDEATRGAIRKTIAAIVDFAASVHSGKVRPEKAALFRNVLLVGIGGSALGPQLVADALEREADRMRVFFLDNTDPDGVLRELHRVSRRGGLRETLTVVVSKSGGTKETRNGMLETAAAYREEGLSFARHAVAVTQVGSELSGKAVAEGWIERFPMWDWVGGRTSVLSAVGLLPAALQGIDVMGLLDGAAACDAATRVPNVPRNPAAMLALAWHRETGGRGARDMVVLPYRDRLLLLSRYLQQLVMESLGKERDVAGNVVNQGIAVYGNKGSTDQHAYVQQLRDGVDNFFVTFVETLCDLPGGGGMEVEPGVTSGDYLHGFLLGTRKALADRGRHSVSLTIGDVSPFSLGVLIGLFERAVGLYASLVSINAYHQPGVEAGKKAAGEVISLQKRVVARLVAEPARLETAEEIAVALGVPAETETVFRLLRHLAANQGRGVSEVAAADPLETRFAAASRQSAT